jgi:hypothetical protein
MNEQQRRRRQKLVEEAAGTIDSLLEWEAAHPEAALLELETELQRLRHRLSESWLRDVVAERAQRSAAQPVACPECGAAMPAKGRKSKSVQTLVGEVTEARVYHYCPACERGLFPPRPKSTTGTGGVE